MFCVLCLMSGLWSLRDLVLVCVLPDSNCADIILILSFICIAYSNMCFLSLSQDLLPSTNLHLQPKVFVLQLRQRNAPAAAPPPSLMDIRAPPLGQFNYPASNTLHIFYCSYKFTAHTLHLFNVFTVNHTTFLTVYYCLHCTMS